MTWYLLCEVAAEETPKFSTVDEKPKAEVKTEKNNHTNWHMVGQDGSVVQCKLGGLEH